MYGAVRNQSLLSAGFPREYIQGPNALAELPQLMARHGFQSGLVIADPVILGPVGVACADMPVRIVTFGGECTEAETERLASGMIQTDLVIGIGGGKCLDTAKMVSILRGVRFFSVPTIASNDAPTSRLVVLYDDNHRIAGTRHMAFNPDAVLVDTDIIARAPSRFLRAGIGDALTKFFETRAVRNSGGSNFLSSAPPCLASTLGAACLETILQDGPDCLVAIEAGERPEGFERLVEALILLSGLAFESGGLSIAHAMARGLTAVSEIAAALHGEQVAYGVLVQLVLEGDDATLQRIRGFSAKVGLPLSLAEFGLEPDAVADAMGTIASGTMTAPYLRNFPAVVRHEDLVSAMMELEAKTDFERK